VEAKAKAVGEAAGAKEGEAVEEAIKEDVGCAGISKLNDEQSLRYRLLE
jgi:hypothetical protein